MKKGYYIHFEGSKVVGVHKKIQMQIGILNKYSECTEVEISANRRSLFNRLLGLLFWKSIPWNYDSAKSVINSPDYIYIRRVNLDFGVCDFYRYLRNSYPQAKILLEVPTYPYDKQSFKNVLTWPFALKDIMLRKKITRFIDGIVVYSDAENIWEITSISVRNGVNYSTVKMPDSIEDDENIDLLTVSSFQKDHGYERVLYGIRDYYTEGGDRKILLHLVGDGDELEYYRAIVNKYSLQDSVVFYGERRGEALEDIYRKADIGLGCFGLYKSGLSHISSLKICEYLAKGLPVVFAGVEDILKEHKEEFVLEFDNNSEPININRVIDFYDKLYGQEDTKMNVRTKIRNDSYCLADMENNYKSVLDYMEITN